MITSSSFEKRIERLSIAGQEAADKLGRGRPGAPKVDAEWQLAASGCVNHARSEGIGAHARAARHDMRFASREDDDFACFNRNRLPADGTSEAPTFRNHMISDHVLGTRQDLRQIISGPGCSATHGALATTSKNAAPVSRTVLNTLIAASAGIGGPLDAEACDPDALSTKT